MILKNFCILALAKLIASSNLAPSATVTSSPPYSDAAGTADIAVIKDLVVSYVPTPTNWVNYLYATADS